MTKIWRASFLSTHNTNQVQMVNTFHGVTTEDTLSVGGDGSADQVRDALVTSLGALYRACLPNTLTLNTLIVREALAPGSTAVPEESSHTFNQAGNISTSGDQLPVPQCVLVTLYSTAAIRSGHGRLFMPNMGNASNLNSASNYDNTSTYWLTTLPAFLNELLTDDAIDTGGGNSATWHPVIYSRTRHGANASPYFFDLRSYTMRIQPHFLRSRMTAP